MRITLERKDLLAILSKSLGYEINDEDVTMNSDPFEVHIRQVPVKDLAQRTPPEVDRTEGEDFIEDEFPEVAAVLTMEEVLQQNSNLSQDGTRIVGKRPLGPQETEEPPLITDEENSALTR